MRKNNSLLEYVSGAFSGAAIVLGFYGDWEISLVCSFIGFILIIIDTSNA